MTMKTYILLLMVFLTACSAKSQKNMDTTLEIDFQDFFKNDTVSLKIGDQFVLKDITVNSGFSTGLTDLCVKVFFDEDESLVQFCSKTIRINNVVRPIIIVVYLNGNKNEYAIDLKQGKYIGFSKKSNALLDFTQAKEPFEYD